jgi:hypothetical protein
MGINYYALVEEAQIDDSRYFQDYVNYDKYQYAY